MVVCKAQSFTCLLQEAGNGSLSGLPLGPLHLRVTTLTSLSQFRPKMSPASPSPPSSGPAPHPQEARQKQSGEYTAPASLNGQIMGPSGTKSPTAAALALSSSSSLSGSEASDSSSRGSSSSHVPVSSYASIDSSVVERSQIWHSNLCSLAR